MPDKVIPLFIRKYKETVSQQGKVLRRYTESFRLELDDNPADIKEARSRFSAETGIESFEGRTNDAAALCRDIDITQETRVAPWTFMVTVEWHNDTPGPEEDREEEDPLDDPVEIETDDDRAAFPLFEDIDGKMIANTANDPIGGVTEEEVIEIVRFIRNEATRDTARDRAYRNAVNSVTISGGLPGTVKCRSIKSTKQYRNQIEYYRYVYEFAWKKSGWQTKVLNAGLYQINADGDRVPCVDRYNEPVSEPVPLDADGAQIAPDDLPDDAIYNTYTTKIEMDFNDLALPF